MAPQRPGRFFFGIGSLQWQDKILKGSNQRLHETKATHATNDSFFSQKEHIFTHQQCLQRSPSHLKRPIEVGGAEEVSGRDLSKEEPAGAEP